MILSSCIVTAIATAVFSISVGIATNSRSRGIAAWAAALLLCVLGSQIVTQVSRIADAQERAHPAPKEPK